MTRETFRASIGVPLMCRRPASSRASPSRRRIACCSRRWLAPELSALHLIVVGDGELRDDLRSRVESLGIAGRVHFLGARRDLGNILAAIDIFVMPSFWEGLPLSMVLAMGAELPVVASRVAGIPEVVKDGVSGLLVDAGDSDATGARRWSALVQRQPASRAARRQAARAFVRPRFGVDGYVASITALYDRLLAAKGHRHRDARHPLSHAVLADRRRQRCGKRKDRSRATSIRWRRTSTSHPRRCRCSTRRRRRDRACARPTSRWRRCRISRARGSSIRCCCRCARGCASGSISAT